MSTRSCPYFRVPQHAPLAACLAATLGLSLSNAHAADVLPGVPAAQAPGTSVFELPRYLRKSPTVKYAALVHAPTKPAGTHFVTTCDDDIVTPTPGTLRYEVANAFSGDTIDLSTLACSVITLDAAVAINQDSLYLKGPAAGPSNLTIDAASQSEVINHFGSSTLLISNLTIEYGYYASSVFPRGGCIYSQGSVGLISSVVSHCTIWSSSDSVPAKGGAVYTQEKLTLINSTITDSEAFATSGANAYGGGAFVTGGLTALYSTISNNVAFATGSGAAGDGGGVYSTGNVDIESSTISGNRADVVGGLDLENGPLLTAKIINSTISSNTSAAGSAGIWTNVPLTLTSTTVAFNRAPQGSSSGGLFASAPLTLQSSMVADNANENGPSDLNGVSGTLVSGANNLITSSTLPPLPNTITDCPQLEPLAINGGATRTHAASAHESGDQSG